MYPKKYEWAGGSSSSIGMQAHSGDCSIWIRAATLEFDDGFWECQVTASDFTAQDALTSQPVRLVVRGNEKTDKFPECCNDVKSYWLIIQINNESLNWIYNHYNSPVPSEIIYMVSSLLICCRLSFCLITQTHMYHNLWKSLKVKILMRKLLQHIYKYEQFIGGGGVGVVGKEGGNKTIIMINRNNELSAWYSMAIRREKSVIQNWNLNNKLLCVAFNCSFLHTKCIIEKWNSR